SSDLCARGVPGGIPRRSLPHPRRPHLPVRLRAEQRRHRCHRALVCTHRRRTHRPDAVDILRTDRDPHRPRRALRRGHHRAVGAVLARRHRINQFMTGLLVVHGALAGAFSPISVYGIFINDYLAKNGLTPTPVSLFFAPLVFNLVFAIAVYLVLHRRPGLRAEADDELSPDAAVPAPEGGAASAVRSGASVTAEATVRLERSQIPTLIGLIAMALSVIVFGWDVGVVTITISAVLAAIDPEAGKAAMSKVSWSVVVLITGVLTYIAV